MIKQLCIITLLFSVSLSHSASFDCSLNKLSKIEKRICDNPQLNIMDEALSMLYRVANEKIIGNDYFGFTRDQNIRNTQKSWLKTRNECNEESCLLVAYKEQVRYLISHNKEILNIRKGRLLKNEIKNLLEVEDDDICNVEILWFKKNRDRDSSRQYLGAFDQIRTVVKYNRSDDSHINSCYNSGLTYLSYLAIDNFNNLLESATIHSNNHRSEKSVEGIRMDGDYLLVGYEYEGSEKIENVFRLTNLNGTAKYEGLSDEGKKLLLKNTIIIPDPKEMLSVSEPLDVAIAVLKTKGSGHKDAYDRLKLSGFNNVKYIAAPIDKGHLKGVDMLYLASGWAAYGGEYYQSIESSSNVVHKYIESGGGLFVEQPNPYKNGEDQKVTPNILPYKITFNFRNSPFELAGVNSEHEITKNIGNYILPYPSDDMEYIDSKYEVLVEGKSLKTSPLLVANYGKGKILVCTHSPSRNGLHRTSDEMIIRMVNWFK